MACTGGQVVVEFEKVFFKLFETACNFEGKFCNKKMSRKFIKQKFSCVNFIVSASCLGSFVDVLCLSIACVQGICFKCVNLTKFE